MKDIEHIAKAQEVLANMVSDGHLKDDFELAANITAAQWELQEAAKRLAADEGQSHGKPE